MLGREEWRLGSMAVGGIISFSSDSDHTLK